MSDIVDEVGGDDTARILSNRSKLKALVESERRAYRYLVIKTIFMVLGPLSMGIYLEIVGPTLLDLRERIGANYEEIARALVARSIGYFGGSLVSGFLVDGFSNHVEFFLAIAYLIGATGTGFAPWCRSLWSLGLMFHLQGWGEGFIDTCNNALCLRLWGKKAPAPIHGIHFGFGAGALLAPQIVRPFIVAADANIPKRTSLPQETGFDGPFTSPIEIPYTISAILCFIMCVVFMAFYVHEHRQARAANTTTTSKRGVKLSQIISPATCFHGNFAFGVQFFLMIFLFYFNIVGGERAFGKYIFSFAVDGDQKFSKSAATGLNTAFWFCFTCGRAVTMIAARYINPKYLLAVELSGNVIIGVVLAVWGNSVSIVLWVFTALLGLFLAPVFPGGLAWANLYANMSGLAVAVVFIGSATGGIVYQWVTGYLFQTYGTFTLMYVMVGYAILMSLTFIPLQLIASRRGELILPRRHENSDDEDKAVESPL